MSNNHSPDEEKFAAAAVKWAKANRTAIANEITRLDVSPGELNPVSVFMAGSPGAGKTEASKALAKDFPGFLRIDPDDLRERIPNYNGANSWLIQGAISRIVDCILDKAFKQNQSFLLDGTLSSYPVAEKNIQRCIDKGRDVTIIYVYQDPTLAWNFVQARELQEGRRIPPERFVDQFFRSHEVVNALKVKFAQAIKIDVLLRNIEHGHRSYHANISNLNHVVPMKFSKEQVELIANGHK